MHTLIIHKKIKEEQLVHLKDVEPSLKKLFTFWFKQVKFYSPQKTEEEPAQESEQVFRI